MVGNNNKSFFIERNNIRIYRFHHNVLLRRYYNIVSKKRVCSCVRNQMLII